MALNHKSRGRVVLYLHFLLRLAGLTGLLACGVGLSVVFLGGLTNWESLAHALLDTNADPVDHWAVIAMLAGGGAALLALAVELAGIMRLAAGRRSAFGGNVALQVGLALLLIAGVNWYSFEHYSRFDWTRNHQFTLPAKVAEDLGKLQGKTTIVVYQRHKTFGRLTDKPDAFDYAAERKVIEKVKDLVEQFRELGTQFKVVVLDVEEEGFDRKVAEEAKDAPQLREAIDKATENTIFFHANGKVQRLSFNDFFLLDKTASQEQGNLVLLDQGVDPFARRVLNIDEKRPRIAVAVVHEVLGLNGSDELGMQGVRKALAANGFEGRDIILKKWGEFTGPEAAVFTYDESKYESLDAQLTDLEDNLKNLQEGTKVAKERVTLWTKSSLEELTKKYAEQLEGHQLTEADRKVNLANFKQESAMLDLFLSKSREERDALAKEKAGLNVESLSEQRRISDLKAKADRMLADCDLLILPRMTLFNVARGEHIPNRVYKLDDAQVAAVKDFLRAGKPVLALFGPSNEPASARMDPASMGPDKLEDVFTELGFRMPRQTILFNVESKSFAERRSGILVLGGNVDVPPVEFDWKAGAGQPLARAEQVTQDKPNPIRRSMELTAHGLGQNQSLDLRLRHPRPIYFEGKGGKDAEFDPVFMMTDPASWNEDDPFPTREHTPRYEPPKGRDFGKSPLDEKRRGPFPIGVGVETTAPAHWNSERTASPSPVRVAAIGHGGVFLGTELSAPREKLLLDTCNWLLGRDDHLPRADRVWEYPRVAMTQREHDWWHWGTRLGLPGLFAYLGLVVLMVRRLR